MFKLLDKKELAANVYLMKVKAIQIAKFAKPGQFIILAIDEGDKKIPFTICDYNSIKGTISIVSQVVDRFSNRIINLKEGDIFSSFIGPLGTPSEFIYEDINILKMEKFLFVTSEIGSVAVYPQIKWLCENKINVQVIISGKSKGSILLDEDIKALGARVYICTDDGSYGVKCTITDKVKELVENGNKYDKIIAIGPMMMMMIFMAEISNYFDVEDIVSLNELIVDGSGAFGACEVTIKQKSKLNNFDISENVINFIDAKKKK